MCSVYSQNLIKCRPAAEQERHIHSEYTEVRPPGLHIPLYIARVFLLLSGRWISLEFANKLQKGSKVPCLTRSLLLYVSSSLQLKRIFYKIGTHNARWVGEMLRGITQNAPIGRHTKTHITILRVSALWRALKYDGCSTVALRNMVIVELRSIIKVPLKV